MTGMQLPRVTVIMAAFNAERYIAAAISSVLEQQGAQVQLVIVDDGSSDGTAAAVEAFQEPRITLIRQTNQGVSVARNRALDVAEGDFICFLDADDVMPSGGISNRLAVFAQSPNTAFVDGAVVYTDGSMRATGRRYSPAFTGDPFPLLLNFDPRCFFGNTWLMRRSAIGAVRFRAGLTHCEDLLFYLMCANGGSYAFTSEEVLHYRVSGNTSMSSLDKLGHGYAVVLAWMRSNPDRVTQEQVLTAEARVRRIMAGSYWHAGRYWSALRSMLITPTPR